MATLHSDSRAILERAFECALRAVEPATALGAALRDVDRRTPALVLGAGKAAASMAAAFAAEWEAPVRGFAVTRYGHGLVRGEDTRGIEVAEAGHPAPDDESRSSARFMFVSLGFWLSSAIVLVASTQVDGRASRFRCSEVSSHVSPTRLARGGASDLAR